MRFFHYLTLSLAAMIYLFSFFIGNAPMQANGQAVVIIPVQKEVEKGLSSFIMRGIEFAERENADHIIFDMDTPGGAVDAATEIAKDMRSTDIPITVLVNKKAISAGAYLALNADQIAMVPGATMGAAAVIDSSGNAADKKAQSFWLKEMIGAAELNGRDPIYAEAMVDVAVDLPEYDAEEGELLTLTANQALEVGYSEVTVESQEELLQFLNLENAAIKEVELSFAEKIARLVTNPVVVPILLSIGSLGLVLELYSPGFGIPGIMGLSALALFFYGHLIAGLAGMESIILLIVGLLAIVLELFIPGGVLGILGIAAVIGSLLLSSASITYMAFSILIAFTVTIIGSIIMAKVFGFKRGFLRHIILSDSTSTEKGYVSYDERPDLLGEEGVTITPLRPSGTASFNEERVDVVTEGGFIEENQMVKVIKVSGGRVIVRQLLNNTNQGGKE
jgi:membrane-bound serine protease (ClpP class)